MIGYSLVYFGEFRESPNKIFWWYFMCAMTIWYGAMFIKATIQHLLIIHCGENPIHRYRLFTTHIWTSLGYLLKSILQIALPVCLLTEPFDELVLKYIAAINVIISCFETMLVVSKWPGM